MANSLTIGPLQIFVFLLIFLHKQHVLVLLQCACTSVGIVPLVKVYFTSLTKDLCLFGGTLSLRA